MVKKRRLRKRAMRKFPPALRYTQEYEEQIILADIAAHPDTPITAKELHIFRPMRYNKNLPAALRRMRRAGLLSSYAPHWNPGYGIRRDTKAKRAA